MRDLILFAALAGIVPLILRAPFVGLLTWIWVALLNPQREVWGFISGSQLNQYIAVLTVLAWLISKERRLPAMNLLTAFLLLFGIWTCVATYFALDRSYSAEIWERTGKTILLALAMVTLATSRMRVQAVLWTIMVSIAFYAVKGAGFLIVTGGTHRVFGPDNSMIADNNSLGLALVVLLPLINYLRVTSRRPVVRWACLAVIGCAVLAILGTYSRGALLALGATAAAFAIRSRHGTVLVMAAALLLVGLPSVLPSSWFDRMATIQSYDGDESFEGRQAAWRTSVNIAKARPLVGGGFRAVELDKVAQKFRSKGSLETGRAAHSIYFEVLGDTGFVGLALYLLILLSAWINTSLVLGATRDRPNLHWANLLGRMLQVSMVGLLVGGAALSMAYYDGFLLMLALTASLLHVVRRSGAGLGESTQPRWKQTVRGELAIPTP
ncbi:putative O-glycosylation ligase, exosortase A system-associated [Phenylobacterium sp.]|uniref:putative O-glycosylation ligase, exosortase A system-associated n=1 Tax=Phenylobacterium sp. TaxID=1871053 RepID=UPI002E3613C6|nr:putative O-glycosylation ligase, exosortase A system-associated [Phenylobacterium sp.]HEX4710789.1 putative O-glycosylation ligase, exosortase A system-associated [Phenylobacterium sp.]